MTTKRLPGLDFVRFYAALSVVLYHIAYNPQAWFGHPVVDTGMPRVFLGGGDAVTLFFVLSGFLITYLLLAEKHKSGTINVQAFYKRRALRILPLYYLVVLLGYVVVPLLFPAATGHPPDGSLPLALLLLPTFITANVWQFVTAHLWSIGVEELYYWFIPVLVKVIRILPLLFLGVFVVRWGFYAVAEASGSPFLHSLASAFRFDCMAIGGIGAYLAHERHFLLKVLYHRAVQALVLLTFALMLLLWTGDGALYDSFKAFLFMVYILNVATNPRALGRIETRWTAQLGAWSYGMYMFHVFVIYILALLLPVGSDALLTVLAVGFTLACAAFSYRVIETPFLNLRHASFTRPTVPRRHKFPRPNSIRRPAPATRRAWLRGGIEARTSWFRQS